MRRRPVTCSLIQQIGAATLLTLMVFALQPVPIAASPLHQGTEPSSITVVVVKKATTNPADYDPYCVYVDNRCRFTVINAGIVYPFDAVNNASTYLRHVLSHEIYGSWQANARYANAVAARTRGWYSEINHVARNYLDIYGNYLQGDITDSTADQACGPINETTDSNLNAAVDLTHGQVLTCCTYGYSGSPGNVVPRNEFRSDSTNPTAGSVAPNISVQEPAPGGAYQGIGLSQWGSQRLASDPRYWGYTQILVHYYTLIDDQSALPLPLHRANFTDYAFPGSTFSMTPATGCSFPINVQNTGHWTWTTTNTGEGLWMRWGYVWYYGTGGPANYYDYRTTITGNNGQTWVSPGETVFNNRILIYAPYEAGTY